VKVLSKKTFADVFGSDMPPLFKFHTVKEDTNTHVHSKNHNLCLLHTQVM